MFVPFIAEKPDVAYGQINEFAPAFFYERRKAVMVFPYIYKLPAVGIAHNTQIVYILRLKGFVIFASVRAGRKFISEIFL